MVFEERLEYLKKQISLKNKFNKEYYETKMGEYFQFEDQSKIQKPLIEAIEHKVEIQKDDEAKHHTFQVDFDIVSRFPKILIPYPTIAEQDNKIFKAINLNKKQYMFVSIADVKYLVNSKNLNEIYPFTDELKLIIEGRGDKDSDPVSLQNYHKIMNSYAASNTKYVKSLTFQDLKPTPISQKSLALTNKVSQKELETKRFNEDLVILVKV